MDIHQQMTFKFTTNIILETNVAKTFNEQDYILKENTCYIVKGENVSTSLHQTRYVMKMKGMMTLITIVINRHFIIQKQNGILFSLMYRRLQNI